MRITITLFALAGLLLSSMPSFGDIAIIGNVGIPPTSISKETAMQIFLKKRSDIEGAQVRILDLPKGDVRNRFYMRVANRTPDNMLAYWYRLMFTGQGQPPEFVSGSEEMLFHVEREPGVVGYVDASIVNNKVKVLLMLKE